MLQLPAARSDVACPTSARASLKGWYSLSSSPSAAPDFGPARVGPAGAVVVGARPFLVAYNVYLQTENVEIAKEIAKRIRESSGGFPAVQAKGFLVEGQAQVSMNLLDTMRTPLHVVYDEIARQAGEHGIAVDRSELIGLMPQSVMLQAAAHYLRLPDFTADRTVEGAIQRRNASRSSCAMICPAGASTGFPGGFPFSR